MTAAALAPGVSVLIVVIIFIENHEGVFVARENLLNDGPNLRERPCLEEQRVGLILIETKRPRGPIFCVEREISPPGGILVVLLDPVGLISQDEVPACETRCGATRVLHTPRTLVVL